MKLGHLLLILLFAAAASAAYFMLQADSPAAIPAPPPPFTSSVPKTVSPEVITTNPETNIIPAVAEDPGVPLEERGDAMLFEIDALQNSPFDDAVTRPFD